MNGPSTTDAGRPVRQHNERQETRPPEELLSGLLKPLTKLLVEKVLVEKVLVEKVLDAEPTAHLGYERNEVVAYVSWKRREDVTAELRRIDMAAIAEEAKLMLGELKARWDVEYLPIGQSWRTNRISSHPA